MAVETPVTTVVIAAKILSIIGLAAEVLAAVVMAYGTPASGSLVVEVVVR